MDIIDYYSKLPSLHFILDNLFIRAISYIMVIIIPLLQKCRNKELKLCENKRSSKQITFDLFYLYLVYTLFFLAIIYLSSLKSKDPENTEDYKMSHYKGLCSEEVVDLFLLLLYLFFY